MKYMFGVVSRRVGISENIIYPVVQVNKEENNVLLS